MDKGNLVCQHSAIVEDCRYMLNYCEVYESLAKKVHWWFSAALVITSSASIVSLAVWQVIPYGLVAVAVISQLLQAVIPLLPFSKRLTALKYFIPALRAALPEIEFHFNHAWDMSDEELAAAIRNDRKTLADLENTFVGDTVIPALSRLTGKAEEKTRAEMRLYSMRPEEGEPEHAAQEAPA